MIVTTGFHTQNKKGANIFCAFCESPSQQRNHKMISSNVLSFRIMYEITRNATKEYRRQFCIMSIVFGGPPEILPMKSWLCFHKHAILPRTADVILVQDETTKSFAISLTYMLDYFP